MSPCDDRVLMTSGEKEKLHRRRKMTWNIGGDVTSSSKLLLSAVMLTLIGSASSQGCWTRRDNIHGFGGRSRRNINSVAACQSVCLSDTSCVAIDYDPWNGNREYCWLLTSIYWTGRARGVTQYVINRQYCSNPGCWSRRDNTHGYGGTPHRNINSVADCQSACLSDTSCVAIDYNPRNRYRCYCWLLTSLKWTGRQRGITQYIINRQHCSITGSSTSRTTQSTTTSSTSSTTTTTTTRSTSSTSTTTTTSTPSTTTTRSTSTPSTTSTTSTVPSTSTTPPSAAQIRLVGSDREGRLEVYYSGRWGTVCDDYFDDVDASVACFQLGFGRNGRSLRNRYGEGSGQIWLDNLRCTGSETRLGDCPHRGWGNHNCLHYEDISIVCNDDSSQGECSAGARFCQPTSACLSADKICNRHQDCPDDSDEVNCTCQSHQYGCTNGRCIYEEWMCDGVADCPLGDDELPSVCNPCNAATQFHCSRGTTCISSRQQCDGSAQCSDSSDEADCLSTATSALLVKYRGVSGYYVCSDQWTSAFSDAVCQQLGHPSAGSTSIVDASSFNQALSLSVASGSTPSGNILQQLRPANCQSRRAVSIMCAAKVCGQRSPNIVDVGPYIINGQWATRGAWPWQIMLISNRAFVCGGSLINNRWVVTAAHCLAGATTSGLQVRLGGLLASDPDPDVVYARVSRMISYPTYNSDRLTGDIALLQLTSPVTYTDTIRPICLPSRDVNLNQFKVCVDTGFGRTSSDGPGATRLLQVKMNLISHDSCARQYGSQIRREHHICIGSQPTADQGICFGDSGGPYACKDQQNSWTLIGINSFVFNSCEQSVVARVSSYVDWIQQTIVSNP